MSAESQRSESPVPLKTKLSYGVADLGICLPLSTVTFFLLYFYTDIIGLSPALAGLAMFLPKMWDAVSDPMMGQISDHTRSRWGRRRPYLLFGSFPYVIAFILLWTPFSSLGSTGTFIYLIITYILFFTGSTVVGVPFNALLPEISLDPHERTKLQAFRQPFAIIGWICGSALVLPLVGMLSGGQPGFVRVAVIFGFFTVLAFVVTFLGVRERPDFIRSKTLSVFSSLRETFKNRLFLIFAAVYVLSSMGYTLLSTSIIYYAKYWLGNEPFFTTMMGLVLGFVLVSIPIWVFLSGKIGKKETFIAGLLVFIIAMALLPLHPPRITPFIYVIMIIAGFGSGAYFIFPYAIMPEIIDVDELSTGTRREGMYFGIYFLMLKLAIALAPAIVGFSLGFFGFEANQEQTETALNGIRMISGFAPLGFLALALVTLLFFPLGKAKADEVSRAMAKMRNSS
ncbi:MAG: MFS transporter [Deltaproteobacteria bacterium]|nr:MFS transporter [Candidatus Zymogenaceae bacterium]